MMCRTFWAKVSTVSCRRAEIARGSQRAHGLGPNPASGTEYGEAGGKMGMLPDDYQARRKAHTKCKVFPICG